MSTKYTSIFLLLLISGCSSIPTLNNPFSGNFSGSQETYNWSAGERTSQKTAYYWLTSTSSAPQTASDYVQESNNTWYKSSYQWKSNALSEMAREGVALQDDGSLKSFAVHIRYSDSGEPIYQRYKLDDKILPLNQWNLNYYAQEAERMYQRVDTFKNQNLQLYQGVWKGRAFTSCEGKQYTNFQYNSKNISEDMMGKFDAQNQYVSFMGKSLSNGDAISIDSILVQGGSEENCIQRPMLIK